MYTHLRTYKHVLKTNHKPKNTRMHACEFFSDKSRNKMESKKYHTVATVQQSNLKIVQKGKMDTLTHKYMTDHVPALVQTLQ
jgi:hypothetical protein